jgi:hypothetical protein
VIKIESVEEIRHVGSAPGWYLSSCDSFIAKGFQPFFWKILQDAERSVGVGRCIPTNMI